MPTAHLSIALHFLRGQAFDLATTYMRLPNGLGIDLIWHVKTHHRSEPNMVIAAHGSAENALDVRSLSAPYKNPAAEVQSSRFRRALNCRLTFRPHYAMNPGQGICRHWTKVRTTTAARPGLSLRQIRDLIARLTIDVPVNTDRSYDVN